MTAHAESGPVVAVANRLPVQSGPDGWQLAPGGLVTALRPVMEGRSGAWVGWDGGTESVPSHLPTMRIDLRPVHLDEDAVAGYYHGFSNRTLWPLLHNAVEKPVFERQWWNVYQEVNERFAAATSAEASRDRQSVVWVHDYHLMLVPGLLRREGLARPIGFFLHVPWPSLDVYMRLPWRAQLLRGVLGADVVGFHTEGYRANFMRACRRLLDDADFQGSDVVIDGHRTRTMTAPISVDAAELSSIATTTEVADGAAALRRQFAERTVLLGVDRLDYTKGIIERLLAIEMLFEREPTLARRLSLVQVAVPSRDDVAEYRELRATVERIVGRINGRFTGPGDDVPIHYLYRSLDLSRLAAYYAAADALLVTPLIDGMNLVAKEYAVVQRAVGGNGVLVLSEFTGAASELKEAVLCNPYDVEGLSHQIEWALALPEGERRRRIGAMARRVRTHDVHRWVASQLDPLTSLSSGS